jgi:hypothetical protein
MNEQQITHTKAGSDAVAVIVVHGVADQPRGDTVQALAQQFAGVSGLAVERSDVTIAVRAREAAVPFTSRDGKSLMNAMKKSWGQSFGSDFLDPHLGGADSRRAGGTASPNEPFRNSAAAPMHCSAEPGVRYTDFLFAKSHDKEAPRTTQPIAVARCRVGGNGTARVDMFEMYWADLSRLAPSALRIFAELVTLMFDLVRLGRNEVAMYATLHGHKVPCSLHRLGRWHERADWLYSRLLAMLTLQLLVCVVIVLLAHALEGRTRGIGYIVAAAAGIAAAGAVVRSKLAKPPAWGAGALAGFACGGVLAWLVYAAASAHPTWLFGALMIVTVVLLACGYWALLGYWEQRFRAVKGFGTVFGALTAICLAIALVASPGGAGAIDAWLTGAMRAIELLLVLQLIGWLALIVLCVGIVALGAWSGRSTDAPARQAIRTGRLGLFASIGVFVVFMMALWALLDTPLLDAAWWLPYRPLWFDAGCCIDAACFLRGRFEGTTATFAVVAVVLSIAFGFVALVVLPCVAGELGLTWAAPATIGRWLTVGYRAFERLLQWWSWLAAGAMLAVPLLLFTAPDFMATMRDVSGTMLKTIVLALAGGTTGLLALGRVGLKRLQALRMPLDAALDVDVHFREFPRKAIPRVLIAERYLALLEHIVVDCGYRRVVIVAHSQGTVITADLLRYLKQREKLLGLQHTHADADADALVRLGRWLARDVHLDLLTVGCPLRQLYATRFPSLYDWVMKSHDGTAVTGPCPAELGVRRWINLWGEADYIGRWLWSRSSSAEPAALAVDDEAYTGTPLEGSNWQDRCIGPIAHMHYFELDRALVREQLVQLIATGK